MSEKIEASSERRSAWDMVSLEQLQELSRRDDCLDIMVPSDLRHIVGRYAEAIAALKLLSDEAEAADTLGYGWPKAREAARAVIAKAGGL